MRSASRLLVGSFLLLALSVVDHVAAAPSGSGAYHLIVPHRAVGPGERVELKLEPPPPVGVRVVWGVFGLSNRMAGLSLPLYRAPYVIPPGTPPARVGASFSVQGARVDVTAEIELRPGNWPGAEECLGPGEAFSTVWGDIELTGNFYVDTLPELIRRVDPVYPRSAFVRGIEDTIIANALVCKSGHVLDAYPVPRYHDRNDSEPIKDDTKLVDAAIAAVRQYVFRPAKSYGQPVAVWVAVRVMFRR